MLGVAQSATRGDLEQRLHSGDDDVEEGMEMNNCNSPPDQAQSEQAGASAVNDAPLPDICARAAAVQCKPWPAELPYMLAGALFILQVAFLDVWENSPDTYTGQCRSLKFLTMQDFTIAWQLIVLLIFIIPFVLSTFKCFLGIAEGGETRSYKFLVRGVAWVSFICLTLRAYDVFKWMDKAGIYNKVADMDVLQSVLTVSKIVGFWFVQVCHMWHQTQTFRHQGVEQPPGETQRLCVKWLLMFIVLLLDVAYMVWGNTATTHVCLALFARFLAQSITAIVQSTCATDSKRVQGQYAGARVADMALEFQVVFRLSGIFNLAHAGEQLMKLIIGLLSPAPAVAPLSLELQIHFDLMFEWFPLVLLLYVLDVDGQLNDFANKVRNLSKSTVFKYFLLLSTTLFFSWGGRMTCNHWASDVIGSLLFFTRASAAAIKYLLLWVFVTIRPEFWTALQRFTTAQIPHFEGEAGYGYFHKMAGALFCFMSILHGICHYLSAPALGGMMDYMKKVWENTLAWLLPWGTGTALLGLLILILASYQARSGFIGGYDKFRKIHGTAGNWVVILLAFHSLTGRLGEPQAWVFALMTGFCVFACDKISRDSTLSCKANVQSFLLGQGAEPGQEKVINCFALGNHEVGAHGYVFFMVQGISSRNKPFSLVVDGKGNWFLHILLSTTADSSMYSNWSRQVLERCRNMRDRQLPVHVSGPWPVGNLSCEHALVNYKAWILIGFETGVAGISGAFPFLVEAARRRNHDPSHRIAVFCRSASSDYLREQVVPLAESFGIVARCSCGRTGSLYEESREEFWKRIDNQLHRSFPRELEISPAEIAIGICGSKDSAAFAKRRYPGYTIFEESFG